MVSHVTWRKSFKFQDISNDRKDLIYADRCDASMFFRQHFPVRARFAVLSNPKLNVMAVVCSQDTMLKLNFRGQYLPSCMKRRSLPQADGALDDRLYRITVGQVCVECFLSTRHRICPGLSCVVPELREQLQHREYKRN